MDKKMKNPCPYSWKKRTFARGNKKKETGTWVN